MVHTNDESLCDAYDTTAQHRQHEIEYNVQRTSLPSNEQTETHVLYGDVERAVLFQTYHTSHTWL
jgi:hypothetical protein